MSATRDSSQKPVFVFSNLYELFRKSQEASREGPFSEFLPPRGQVLKPGSVTPTSEPKLDVSKISPTATQIRDFKPVDFLPKREVREITRPVAVPPAPPKLAPKLPDANRAAVEDLKKNLGELKDLHGRLKFLLQELEELSRE